MNTKSVKLIRKLCKTFKLDYDLQKGIFKRLSRDQQTIYLQDALKNLSMQRDLEATITYKNG